VIEIAAQSPSAALLALGAEIEREVRELLASLGLLLGRTSVPLQQALAELSTYGLPKHLPGSLELFWDVRNKLVHGRTSSPDDVLRAIDSGVAILKALYAIPRETNIVYHPGVTVYADEKCMKPISDAKGLILETQSPSGVSVHRRIYPTTKTDYEKGKRVAWEWSDRHRFGEAWYKDPDTGETKYAWTSSMEFVGRHLDQL